MTAIHPLFFIESLITRQSEAPGLSKKDIQGLALKQGMAPVQLYQFLSAFDRFQIHPKIRAHSRHFQSIPAAEEPLGPLAISDKPVLPVGDLFQRLFQASRTGQASRPTPEQFRAVSFFHKPDNSPSELILYIGDYCEHHGLGRFWLTRLEELVLGLLCIAKALGLRQIRLLISALSLAEKPQLQMSLKRLIAEIAQLPGGDWVHHFEFSSHLFVDSLMFMRPGAIVNALHLKRPEDVNPIDPESLKTGIQYGKYALVQPAAVLGWLDSIFKDPAPTRPYIFVKEPPRLMQMEQAAIVLSEFIVNYLKPVDPKSILAVNINGVTGQLFAPEDTISLKDFSSSPLITLDLIYQNQCLVHYLFQRILSLEGQTCGRCIPCIFGVHALRKIIEDISRGIPDHRIQEKVFQLTLALKHTARCDLGKKATHLLRDFLDRFAPVLKAHYRFQCPARQCFLGFKKGFSKDKGS